MVEGDQDKEDTTPDANLALRKYSTSQVSPTDPLFLS